MSTIVIYEDDELMHALLNEWLSEAGKPLTREDLPEAVSAMIGPPH